jgi:hypothetical protein
MVTFNFTVIAPGSAGTYNFQWQMLQEGIAWFGDQTPNVPVTVDVNAATFVSQSVPTRMIAGLRYNASVTMRNTGTTTWTEDELYRLAAQNPQDNATWGENREFLPTGAAVVPGDTVTFSFRVEAPLTAGNYNFQWQMSEDLVQTFGQQTPNVVVVVDSLGAQFISQSVPTAMTSATTYPISITMKNVGTTTWTSGSYALGSQNLQDNTTWGFNRVNLPAGTSVAPGSSYTFTFNVTAPSTATGTYNFEWRMINIGVAWFGELTPNVAVSVTGNAAISTGQTIPTSMIGGRVYPISVTMKNTGTTTWAGNHRLGSQNPQDNFIWGFNRVNLPSGLTVAPGASYTFNFNVTAPTNAGTYNMQWKMQQFLSRSADAHVLAANMAAVNMLAARHESLIEHLLAQPQALLHGEFYASNILVQQRADSLRVCPIDWEMAAVGPRLVDLAALASGKWSETQRDALALAYYEAMAPANRPLEWREFVRDLDCCRLHLAIQWCGWFGRRQPISAHAHDWLSEAVELATRLDL